MMFIINKDSKKRQIANFKKNLIDLKKDKNFQLQKLLQFYYYINFVNILNKLNIKFF